MNLKAKNKEGLLIICSFLKLLNLFNKYMTFDLYILVFANIISNIMLQRSIFHFKYSNLLSYYLSISAIIKLNFFLIPPKNLDYLNSLQNFLIFS